MAAAVAPEQMEAAPRGQEMERAYDGTDLGSIESLGRWNASKWGDRGANKLTAETAAVTRLFSNNEVRAGFGNFFDKLVDELVQQGASSGILAINNWKATRGRKKHRYTVVVYGFSWSASPDDTSYQRHGAFDGAVEPLSVSSVADSKDSGEKPLGFADFEGVVDDLGGEYMAVYRVTLPSGGLDPDKWAGRPPPPAPADLYTGPRDDGLLSTDAGTTTRETLLQS